MLVCMATSGHKELPDVAIFNHNFLAFITCSTVHLNSVTQSTFDSDLDMARLFKSQQKLVINNNNKRVLESFVVKMKRELS